MLDRPRITSDSGSWAEKAIKEARKVGTVNVAASTKGENYSRIPAQGELKLTPGAAYVHMTANNTIEGTEFKALPDVDDAPLVSDTSSDMFSRPIDVAAHGLIYAGAQKNLGPSGVTLVIIREDLLARSVEKKAALPTMLNYQVHAENTLALQHPAGVRCLRAGPRDEVADGQGGLAGDRQRSTSARPGSCTRRSIGPASTAARRATGRPLADERHVPARAAKISRRLFVKESTAAGLDGLKGHRAVGGMRASIYNAFPEAGCRRARLVHARLRGEARLKKFRIRKSASGRRKKRGADV